MSADYQAEPAADRRLHLFTGLVVLVAMYSAAVFVARFLLM
jgi:hypothetical protein